MVIATAAGFASCSDDDDYVPAQVPGNAQVYFSNAQESTVNIVEDQTEFDVLVLRQDTVGDLTVNILANDPSGIFTIPSSVTFVDGKATANLHVTFDFADIEGNVKYPISLKVDEKDATLYGDASTSFVVLYAPWKSIGKCVYQGDFVQTFFSLPNVKYLVEVEESMTKPGLYRLVNPYSLDYEAAMSNALGEELGGEYDLDNNYYMVINATDPKKVYIEESPTGMDFGYGNFTMFSIAGLRIAQNNPSAAEGNYGQVKDGVITFPKNSLLVSMAQYNDGGLYQANGSGKFKLVLPGGVDGDYSINASLAGIIDYVGGIKKAVVEVTTGKDVKTTKVAVITGADVESAVEGIEKGDLEGVVTLNYSEQPQTVDFTLDDEGTYSIVAVTYNKDGEAQETVSSLFSHYDNDNWTSLGVGEYADGLLLPLLEGFEPMSWEAEIQQHNEKTGLYRVLQPYWPLDEEANGALVIDATDPEHVYVPYTSSEVFLEGNGTLDWYSEAADLIDHGATIEDILAAESDEEDSDEVVFGTFANGVITLPAGAAGIMFNGDLSSFIPSGYETVITLPTDATAKAKITKARTIRPGAISRLHQGKRDYKLRSNVKTFVNK